MSTCEETSKSQLSEIKNAMSQISTLPVKTIQLRRLSQEQHVQRMLKARNRGETPSAVFVMPSSSPVREPKRTYSPPKPISQNNKVTKELDEQAKSKTFQEAEVSDQDDEKVLKTYKPDCRKITLKVKDKMLAKHGKTEIKKTKMKSTLSLEKNSKHDKPKPNLNGNQSTNYPLHKSKILYKKSQKKGTIFHNPHSPSKLDKADGNTLEADCKNESSPVEISRSENVEPEKIAENPSDKAAFIVEQSNSEIKTNVVDTNKEDEENNETVNVSEGCQFLKRHLKKKKKAMLRLKSKPVKPNPQKDKKMRESRSIDLHSNWNQSSKPLKCSALSTVFATPVKKNSSVVSRSISLDSLDDRQKALAETISPVPQTIDKVLNFINNKKDAMESISLESDEQMVKRRDNSSKPAMNLNGLARGSKIPFHEFRKRQTRYYGKDTGILEDPFHGNYITKDKECNGNDCFGDTCDISPIVNPFKSEKSIAKPWLTTIPDTTQNKEKTGKKTRELIPNSINFITANNTVETGNKMISENDVSNFNETGKRISPTPKDFHFSSREKSPEYEEPEPGTATGSLSSSALTVPEMEDEKRFEILKNAFRTSSKSPKFKFATPSKDFLMNPIEKFMNEINFAMNDLDLEEVITES